MPATLRARIEGLHARQQEIAAEIEVLGGTEGDSEAQAKALEQIKALNSEFDENESSLEVLAKAKAKATQAQRALLAQTIPAGATIGGDDGQVITANQIAESAQDEREDWEKIRMSSPARAKRHISTVYSDDREAYFSGLAIHAVCGNAKARQKLNDNELGRVMNAMSGGNDPDGGYAVPDPMAREIIRLVEEYGVFRQNARNMPMTSDTLDVPKRANGLTVYYPGEGNPITPSDITFAQVNLIAKKYAQLAIWSSELDEDAVISMTDLVTTEMAWGFAQAEDTNSFLGDGGAPFGTITGIKSALQAGAQVTGAATWAGQTLAMYHQMVGKVQWYPGIMPKWYINHQGWAESMQQLAYSGGGNATINIAAGMPEEFLGYPVVKTQALPRDPSASTELIAVFGDLRLGSMLGTRRDVRLQILRELYAANDQIGLVGTMRSDTQIHDVGDATNAGCIVGLYSPV